jgi:two-component system sensor histidine kinase UhpB
MMDRLLTGLMTRLSQTPFSVRLLIGNALVVLVGALTGTLITRAYPAAPLAWLILIFWSSGIFLTLTVNYIIFKTALAPLETLKKVIGQVQVGKPAVPPALSDIGLPELQPIAAEIQELIERLDQYSGQLRAFSEGAISAQEEERKRIARGLHDDTAQALSSLVIQLERLGKILPPDYPEAVQRLADVRRLAIQTLEGLRKIIYGLRPSMLDDLGLVPAIRWYTRNTLEDTAIRVQYDIPNENLRLHPNLETLLFRIAQEGVNNVLRHSNASHVTVRLVQENDHLRLEVIDDGLGFNVSHSQGLALPEKRLGLLGIRERAALVGGEVFIDSAPGRGTRLQVNVPLEQPEMIPLVE